VQALIAMDDNTLKAELQITTVATLENSFIMPQTFVAFCRVNDY
jgi:hypothetical protein